MKVSIVCKHCGKMKTFNYQKGIFDWVFYDEPRFPGNTIYSCEYCRRVTVLGGSILVKVSDGDKEVPVKVKTDDFIMTFSIRDFKGNESEYDILRLEEVVKEFFANGSLPR